MDDALRLDALLAYVEGASLAWQFSRRPQLGLYYLAQAATDAGFQVRVDNLSANDHVAHRLDRLLTQHDCHLLGLYVDQDNLWDLRRILPALKKFQPGVTVIVGGPQVTADPETTLERLPQAACGCIGEGEETFVELLSLSAYTPESLAACKGLIIRDGHEPRCTPPRAPIRQLDRFSIPQRDFLTIDDQRLSPTMITGRGCTGRCTFCYEGRSPKAGKVFRVHSLQRCLEEFDYLVERHGQEYVCILDDTFVADVRRLREFCRALRTKYQGQIKWFCEARADSLSRDPELLPMMVEAGLIRMQIGGESGCQRILDAYHKDITLEQILTVVDSAKTNGLLSLYINFIVGGAFETNETYQQTRDFALGLLERAPGCVSVGKSYYTPYPGTPMYEDPAAYGLQILDRDVVTGFGDHHVFCRTEGLNRFEILALGYDFDKCVKETVKRLCRALSGEMIERHFDAYHQYKISTEWHDVLAEDLCLGGYFAAVLRSGAKRFAEAAAQDFRDCYPMRNIDLRTSMEEQYVVGTPLREFRRLDPLESILIELSAGKLSLDEILQVISDQLPGHDPRELREAAIERYARFDRDFLLVWKTNPL